MFINIWFGQLISSEMECGCFTYTHSGRLVNRVYLRCYWVSSLDQISKTLLMLGLRIIYQKFLVFFLHALSTLGISCLPFVFDIVTLFATGGGRVRICLTSTDIANYRGLFYLYFNKRIIWNLFVDPHLSGPQNFKL